MQHRLASGVSVHFEPNLSCPACFRELGLALVEDGKERRPSDGDHTVCTHCTVFLKYVEKISLDATELGLAVVDRDAYEGLPERHQIALMNVRNKLISVRVQGREQQGAIAGLMAREISKLKKQIHSVGCRCYYCSSGDSLNCTYRRRA
jgi:hypothetical protein